MRKGTFVSGRRSEGLTNRRGQTSGARQSPIRFPYQYSFGRTAVRPYRKESTHCPIILLTIKMKTLIAGGTACLKRCRLITQKNNKKLSDVKIEWPSSCERFCTGSGSSICETAALVSLSALLGEQPFAPTERNRHTIL